jgi:hypothetical protein
MIRNQSELLREIERAFRPPGIDPHEVSHPGIPGGRNYWFPGWGQARRAALRHATRLGTGHSIEHDPRPARGLPHYHVIDGAGRRVSGHFFYGRRTPRPGYPNRFQREGEDFLTLIHGGGLPGSPNPYAARLMQARARMNRAIWAAQNPWRGRLAAQRALTQARVALRGVTGITPIDNALSEASNSLRLNNPARFRTFLQRAIAYTSQAIQRWAPQ